MLSVQVFTDSSLSDMLADLSAKVNDGGGLRFSTNRHGFASLEAPFIPMSMREAFTAYEWPGTPHVVVSDRATGVVWEGRLEDIAIVDGGVSLTAFGYQRALWDLPYTALWSVTGTADWKPITEDIISGRTPDRYEMDNNNRIYMAPRKGETFTSGTHNGTMGFQSPHLGARSITNFSCSYAMLLPTNWQFRLASVDAAWSGPVENTVTANGSAQSGTLALTLGTPGAGITVDIRNNSGSDTTITADTGTNYLKLTDIRMKSTTAASVLASAIAAAMATYVSGINSAQLSSSTALVTATATDLNDEVYEDEWPADILDRLALLHSYQWAVWEGQKLTFAAVSSAPRAWYVDVVGVPQLQRSLEKVRNSAYGIYRDASGATLRTNTVGDSDSQTRYEVLRRGFVSVQTTSLGEAQTHRSVWLTDHADMQARARIEFDRVYDATGAPWPLWAMRAGDTITMRNLPPTLSIGVDRIRTFTIGETEYDAVGDSINIAPDDPIPTLVTLVARREAGL